ncbi:hypothetical protein JCM10908_001463 [Rhodotorula pacifica]|uniref:uncharacterized protein n=1 Tax=Rhodotorula pacifica TaxID=1495444 RepID=UPI00316FFFCB
MPSLHDTRLLSNLLKTEKDTMQAFRQYTNTAATAGSALSAWSVADSADTGDLMDAAIRISQLLGNCTEAQRLYLHALSAYRVSLKEILARETALRTVVRDREILVNRLIKVGNKKPKEGHEREHELKLEDAQRELQACETFLQEEEAALAHVKRLSFRESLNNRMKEMGHLARVMEDSAAEAVAILDSLHGPDGDFTPSAHRFDLDLDLGSDDGSIAPSQSASQAISRSSSTSSLAEMAHRGGHANGPEVPEDLHIDPNARPTSVVRRERSFSPTRSPDLRSQASVATSVPAIAPIIAPAPARPIMPAVPTAPPPISQTVYTERVPGMPTFEIPRAPDLSRRPDYSSESEYDDDEPQRGGGGGGGYGRNSSRLQTQNSRRSMRFSSVQPPSIGFGGGGGRASYGRRAMSESGSINSGREGHGGRKRRGSFFGGLASLFRRGKKHEHDEETENDYSQQQQQQYQPSASFGRGGRDDPDYADARSRLAAQQSSAASVRSRATTAADARADAVMESVMNAGMVGRRPTRGGASDSSDDDERPTSVVRHVNDPKARIKALSDVGRSSAPHPTVTVAPQPAAAPVPNGRPKLQRKGTSSSSVRPPPAGAAAAVAPVKERRAARKAASDIGVPPSRWNGNAAMSSSPSSPVLQVPRAPTGPGIAELANGSMLPLSRPAGPAFAPRAANTGTPSSPAETGTLIRKKTKKTKVDPREAQLANIVASVGTVQVRPRPSQQQQQQTVVLSAESLGMSTSSAEATSKPALVRSNTNASTATAPVTSNAAATTTMKKKKVKASGESTPTTAAAAAPPSADDLAASLPRAATGPTSFSTQLPRPDDDPTAFKSGPPLAVAAPVTTTAAPKPADTVKRSESTKPVKALAEKEKKAKHVSALHGVSDSTWVAPPSPQPVAAPRSMPTPPRRSDVHKGDESLMSVVDRAEGNDNVKPSRSYASSGTSTPTPSSGGNSLTVPPATTGRATPSWLANTNGATSAAMTPQLSKRKSVRLADADPNAKSVTLSPSPSMRSTTSSAAAGQPKHGILVQRDQSPAPGSVAASLSNGSIGGGKKEDLWPTRATLRQRMQDSDDSSDEGEGMKAYRAARKALGRGTKDMDAAMQGTHSREEKGKGRAA